MASAVVFVLILATTTFATAAASTEKIYASENPVPVGNNVTLFIQDTVAQGAWLFNTRMIVIIFPGGGIIASTWGDRVTFNSTTSSITIRSLQLEDSGLYELEALGSFRAHLTLSVQVPISNVTLRANATNLVEFNDTAVLMCSVQTGSSLSYVWLKGSAKVTASGGVQLTDGGATLVMAGVTRYDEGPFRCNVSNGVSNEISLSFHLNISYGPSNTIMKVMPMRSAYMTGSNITLSCSAESSPAATIQWMYNGMYLNQSGPKLQLESVTESKSGNYKCLLHNPVTARFSSKSAMIRIVAPIAAVVVDHTGGPAILHEPFTLRCEVTGFVSNIHWWRNGQLIHTDNTTVVDKDNKTLTLNPVQHSDNGGYQCQAFNPLSNMTSSPYTVKVNYGPMKPVTTGPSMALTGTLTTLNCSSASHPPSHISWYFNSYQVATTPELTIGPLTLNMSGKYICTAYNNITGKNSTAYTMLAVLGSIESVQVETPMNPAIEGHFYELTCSMTGHVEHVYWMKNGEPLHEDNRTVFHKDNKTVTFNPVEYNDTGHYQCMAINALENITSPPHKLILNFGPKKPMIDGPAFAEMGRNATFHCHAMSMPPSQYSWWFNGSNVANSSVFTTDRLSFNTSGEYTCRAYNHVTRKSSTNSKMLTVIEAIQSVVVRDNNRVPINSENFTLTCDVTGPYDTVYWMKDGMQLNMTNSTTNLHMSYDTGNNTLHFTPVTVHDDGVYQCVATNQAGPHESPRYTLLVNYGPLSVTISGPFKPNPNVVFLACSADSRPDSDFLWFLNSQSSAPVHKGSVITFFATKQNEGDYICQASNPVTNITKYETQAFTVSLPAHASALHFPSQGALMLMGLFALFVPAMFI